MAILVVIGRELASEFAVDWLKDNLWVVGTFLAWRWSSAILAALIATVVLLLWQAVDHRDRGKAIPPQASPDESIVVLEPTNGAEIPRVFWVRGFANTFESNVVVEDQKADRTWEVVAITMAGGMMGGLTSFSVGLSLRPGKHRLRIGDYSPKDGEWSGVEIDVTVRKAEPQSTEYEGILWVHNGYRGDSRPTVRPECPDHRVRLFYREGVSKVIPVRQVDDDDEIGPYSTLVCVNEDGHDVRLTSGRTGVRFGDLIATVENQLAKKLKGN